MYGLWDLFRHKPEVVELICSPRREISKWVELNGTVTLPLDYASDYRYIISILQECQ